jgi:hypothetical protein
MLPLLTLLLPALLPVFSDGVRGLINRLTGGAGAQPANVEEAIKLMGAETEKLKALAELDKPAGDISRWVTDLRASFRYLAAALIIIGTFGLTVAPSIGMPVDIEVLDTAWNMMGSVFAFMFGDRMYMGLKKR